MNVLVDADIIAYRAAYSARDEPEKKARQKVDEICNDIMCECHFPSKYTLGEDTWFYLTGGNNFRFDIATIKPYKGKRGNLNT